MMMFDDPFKPFTVPYPMIMIITLVSTLLVSYPARRTNVIVNGGSKDLDNSKIIENNSVIFSRKTILFCRHIYAT